MLDSSAPLHCFSHVDWLLSRKLHYFMVFLWCPYRFHPPLVPHSSDGVSVALLGKNDVTGTPPPFSCLIHCVSDGQTMGFRATNDQLLGGLATKS